MDIKFVKPSHHYDSYVDYWELVRLAGFAVCSIPEVKLDSETVYVLSPMNGEWEPNILPQVGRAKRKAHIIHWLLERPSGCVNVPRAQQMIEYVRSNMQLQYDRLVDETWVSDRQLALETGFRFVPVGSDRGLGKPAGRPIGKEYHLAHMSYVNHRRERLYNRMRAVGCIFAPNAWPPHREQIIHQSMFGLCTHKDEYPYMEPLRIAVYTSYGMPIIGETVKDAYPLDGDAWETVSYAEMPERVVDILNGSHLQKWVDMGKRAQQRMCDDFNFGKVVREAINV